MAEILAREIHAGTIQRVHTFATGEHFHLQPLRNLRTRLEHLKATWQALQLVHHELLQATEEAEARTEHTNQFADIEEMFLDTDAKLRERIGQIEQQRADAQDEQNERMSEHSHESVPEREHDRPNVQPNLNQAFRDRNVPVIQNVSGEGNENPNQPLQVGQMIPQPHGLLPWEFRIQNIWGEFDGDRKKWQAFHDSFKARIYDDPLMPAVQKFQIMKSALKGKAAKSLGEWQICDRNFEPAWMRLKELYDDPYVTSKELWQKLSNLKKLDEPNGSKLQILSNVTQEVYRQLGAMGHKVEHFELFFIHTIQEKLDEKTSVSWDLQRKDDNPTLLQFTGFLDRQAKALCNANSVETVQKSHDHNDRKRQFGGKSQSKDNKRFRSNDSSGSQPQKKPFQQQSVVKDENGRCAICYQEHLVRKCPEFAKLNLTKRKEKAREKNLCFKCLCSGHMISGCKLGPCTRCNKQHSALLCPENPNNRNVNVAKKAPWKSKPNKKNKKSTSSQ